MRTYLFYLYCAWELMIKTVFDYKRIKKAKEENNEKVLDKFFIDNVYHKTVQNILNVAGVKLEVKGKENIPSGGPTVFICNHQGNFDVITLVRTLDRRVAFIVKKELQKVPMLGKWIENMGSLFIERDNLKQSVQIINEAIDFIKGGNAMFIFPEGTRSKGDTVGEFKSGSFKLAVKSNSIIVPITISDSYKIMEANKGKIKPGTVKITYHKPIETKDMSKEDQKELHNVVREIIASAI